MTDWPWLIFVTAIGACVGSFLNVVIYRLPAGESLVTPGSHCPRCGHALSWFENVPVLGWIFLRGKCRHCKAAISVQYPLIEAICAVLFGGLFAVYYYTHVRTGFAAMGWTATWPAAAVQMVLLAALLAATVIDARLYIIPVQIPWTATVVAVLGLPLAAGAGWLAPAVGRLPRLTQVVAMVGWPGIGIAVGGIVGLLISLALMRSGIFPRSFDEVEGQVDEPLPPDAFLAHPHPRREVLKELLFLALPVLGMVVGGLAMRAAGAVSEPGFAWRVLGGVVCGYLMGGGVVWGTRILGTLGFGKEAMGLGDVHLLAGIGAVLGPMDAVLVFFIAPFLGLIGALVMAGLSAIVKGEIRVIPYGPYLAGAALVVMVFREGILRTLGL